MKFRRKFITGAARTVQAKSPSHFDTMSTDQLSIMGYDHAVTKWLKNGRQGPRPRR